MRRHKLEHEIEEVEQELKEVLRILHPQGIDIQQLNQGGLMPVVSVKGESMVTGITAGQTGTFQEVALPAGSAFPLGTTFVWASDAAADTSLTPSGDGTHVAVAVAATPTQTSFNLTCTSSFTPTGASAPLSVKVNVPILGVTPPQTPTSMDINQLS